MDKPVPRNTEVLLERCESGRIGLTANGILHACDQDETSLTWHFVTVSYT